MANSGQSKMNEQTQAFIDAIKQINRETIRDKRIKQGAREGEKLDRTPIAIATGAVKPDTLTSALNRIMIASDPEAWDRLHDYDYESGDEGESDTGDFEAETDFEGNKKDPKGHYDEPKKATNGKTQTTNNVNSDGNNQETTTPEKGGKDE